MAGSTYLKLPAWNLSVQDDIVRSLNMLEEDLFKVIHPFNRANLFYEVSSNVLPSV